MFFSGSLLIGLPENYLKAYFVMNIPILPPGIYDFPNPAKMLSLPGNVDGLVAVSLDLAPERLLAAYPKGIFPWFGEKGVFYWFCTAPRFVLRPEDLHIGRSLRKTLRHKPYQVWVNRDFSAVMRACAEAKRPEQDGTWIAPDFQVAYGDLHQRGAAHSFECYYPDDTGAWQLAGGLYGVQIGQVFFGESMFANQADASKIAFAYAVGYLAACGVRLIDCQQESHHLARFGASLCSLADFQVALLEGCGADLAHEVESNWRIDLNDDLSLRNI